MENQKSVVQVIARLEYSTYRVLEKKLTPPVVTDRTTDIQAGYQLGIQAVLKELREGFVVGEQR